MNYTELLIGCGHARNKLIVPPGSSAEWRGLVTLDVNEQVMPDIRCDIDHVPWDPSYVHPVADYLFCDESETNQFHFRDSCVDEIHAYEVLEHLGGQGKYHQFFWHFQEIWRVLKPGGYLCATVPSRYSPWLWGDPGHRRAILQETLIFLDQLNYIAQCGRTAMSDYRDVYKADFTCVKSTDDRTFHTFILQAIKPSRINRAK